jgi:intracellular septation protein
MKILFDLFPVILFFGVFKLAGANPESAQAFAHWIGYAADPQHLPVLLATAAAMLATLAQIVWVKLRHGKVDTMLWVSFAIIVVFGGATLLLHDEAFIKFKPSALYWLFAGALLLSRLLFQRNLIRSMMQEKMTLPDRVWDNLNYAWSGFFAVLGVLNLYVAYNFSTEAWVNFKLFGATGLMFIFILLHAFFLAKYLETDEKEKN